MNVDSTIIARVRYTMHEAIGDYLFDRKRKINLIDFGWKEVKGQKLEDVPAIRFHVVEKPSLMQLEATGIRPLPPSIGPFPTDVLVGTYRPHRWRWSWWGGGWAPPANPAKARADPMRGGISISDESHYAAGTLGGKVFDRATSDPMILSNWHVLVAEWGTQPGQLIYQPGRLDGGTHADTVATMSHDAMSNNLDAAVARLTGSRGLSNYQLNLGPVTGVSRAQLGMQVVKSGRTTGITYGRVTGVEGTAAMRYGYVDRIIRNVVTIDQRTPGEQVSAGGDSGSMWLDSATKQAIGLHFAGSDSPERGLALDMQSVLDALNVTIIPGL